MKKLIVLLIIGVLIYLKTGRPITTAENVFFSFLIIRFFAGIGRKIKNVLF